MECFEKWFSKTIWKKRIVLFKVTFGGGFPMLCCTFEVIFERIFENDVQKNLEKKNDLKRDSKFCGTFKTIFQMVSKRI